MIGRSVGILAVVAALLLAACTAPAPTAPAPTAADQSWERVALPAGFTGSQLLVVDGRLVVGGSQGEAPAILVADAAGMLAPIPVTPTTFYGALARWSQIAADGAELRALGGRTGGGHGNPRWSTWVGDLGGVAELHTPGIEVFGGWRGGGMVGVAVVDGQAVIVGGRAGDAAGLDIAVWLEQGDAWVEQSSTGTPLGATDDRLPFPTSVVADGSDLLITGFSQRLGGGDVRLEATAWAGGPTGPWTRVDLPGDDEESRADAASCADGRCVIVGRGDGGLRAWSLVDGEVAALPLPVLAADADVPAPATWDGRTAVAVAAGIAVSADLEVWSLRTGPGGTPRAIAAVGSTLYVLAAAGDGPLELWRSS